MSKEQGSESTVSRSQFIKEEEMAKEKEAPKGLSRKDFVKGAAAVAGVGALAGCAPAATPEPAPTCPPAPECPPAQECAPCPTPWLPETWDKEADVVVVGSGAAGGPAAIEAHDAGAKVLLLEKMPVWGGSLALAGGTSAVAVGSKLSDAIAYMVECGEGLVTQEMAAAWAEESAGFLDWLTSIGVSYGEPAALSAHWRDKKGADAVASYQLGESGADVAASLEEVARNRGIDVMLETPATELVATPDGEVLGVLAEQKGSKLYVKAKKGVILACGGIDHNEWLKVQYFKHPLYAIGTPGDTGDAITLAEEIGARLWKPSVTCGIMCQPHPETESAWFTTQQIMVYYGATYGNAQSMIMVDRYGKRFASESMNYDAFFKEVCVYNPVEEEYSRIPCYGIFDETEGEAYTDEVEKGWVAKANTIGELAEQVGMEPATLEDTVTKYNGYCAAGEDPDFNRQQLKAIEMPPYYAIATYPGTSGTFCGPEINPKAQVINTRGDVIPRLYAAGCASGGVVGFLYPISGISLSEGFTFGRVAGRNAASEESWE